MALAITDPKPRLRGWLHLGAFPAAITAGLILIATAPTLPGRLSTAVYIATSAALFGISALYHRTNLAPRPTTWLKRLDHANIYLIIAGTYTPIAVLALDGTPAPHSSPSSGPAPSPASPSAPSGSPPRAGCTRRCTSSWAGPRSS